MLRLAVFLGHAQPKIVLGTVGMMDSRKKNTGATVKYRRWLPKGATTSSPNIFFPDATTADRSATYAQAQQTSEGVTPNAETLTPQDFSVNQLQFSVLYGFTDQTADLYGRPDSESDGRNGRRAYRINLRNAIVWRTERLYQQVLWRHWN